MALETSDKGVMLKNDKSGNGEIQKSELNESLRELSKEKTVVTKTNKKTQETKAS